MSAARMSVILVTDRLETIARAIARLHAQTVAHQLEIVASASSRTAQYELHKMRYVARPSASLETVA